MNRRHAVRSFLMQPLVPRHHHHHMSELLHVRNMPHIASEPSTRPFFTNTQNNFAPTSPSDVLHTSEFCSRYPQAMPVEPSPSIKDVSLDHPTVDLKHNRYQHSFSVLEDSRVLTNRGPSSDTSFTPSSFMQVSISSCKTKHSRQ